MLGGDPIFKPRKKKKGGGGGGGGGAISVATIPFLFINLFYECCENQCNKINNYIRSVLLPK